MRYSYLMVVCVVLFLVGCGSQPHPVIIDTTIPARQGQIPTQVIPAEEDIGARGILVRVEEDNKGVLQLLRITESLTQQNYLELTLVFQNSDPEDPVNGEYQVQFFNHAGLPVENPLGWRPLTIPPQKTVYESVVAPNETANYYKVDVKTQPIQKSY